MFYWTIKRLIIFKKPITTKYLYIANFFVFFLVFLFGNEVGFFLKSLSALPNTLSVGKKEWPLTGKVMDIFFKPLGLCDA